jgi:hypothetical protein
MHHLQTFNEEENTICCRLIIKMQTWYYQNYLIIKIWANIYYSDGIKWLVTIKNNSIVVCGGHARHTPNLLSNHVSSCCVATQSVKQRNYCVNQNDLEKHKKSYGKLDKLECTRQILVRRKLPAGSGFP